MVIPAGGRIKPGLFAGPFFSVSVGAAGRTDFGLSFGGGIDFDLAGVTITTDARYSFGLKEAANITTFITDATGNRIYENKRSIKNRVISLMVGVSL